jgi:hypothetical protein
MTDGANANVPTCDEFVITFECAGVTAPVDRTWTPADVEAALIESTERSGVPLRVEDPLTLRRLATLARREEREAS